MIGCSLTIERIMTNSKMDEVDAPKFISECTMMVTNTRSHVISKSYFTTQDEVKSILYSQSTNTITSTILFVYVYEPKIMKTYLS